MDSNKNQIEQLQELNIELLRCKMLLEDRWSDLKVFIGELISSNHIAVGCNNCLQKIKDKMFRLEVGDE